MIFPSKWHLKSGANCFSFSGSCFIMDGNRLFCTAGIFWISQPKWQMTIIPCKTWIHVTHDLQTGTRKRDRKPNRNVNQTSCEAKKCEKHIFCALLFSTSMSYLLTPKSSPILLFRNASNLTLFKTFKTKELLRPIKTKDSMNLYHSV